MLICIVNHFKDYLVNSHSETYFIIELFSDDYQPEKCLLTDGQTLVPEYSIDISNFYHNTVMKKNLNCVTLNNRKAENFVMF